MGNVWLELIRGRYGMDRAIEIHGIQTFPPLALAIGFGEQAVVRHAGLRRLRDTVLLDQLRCDGGGHGGCQASCHLLWKEAWLRRSSVACTESTARATPSPPESDASSRETSLHRFAQRVEEFGAIRYVCQATQIGAATTTLAWTDPRHYLRDLLQGNVRLRPFLVGVSLAMFNWAQRKRGGVGYPRRTLADQKTSPHEVLNLQPGEVVRVKSMRDIERTLNAHSRNRGLWFDVDMLRHCGAEYRVRARVERVVDEGSGKLVRITNPCVILEGVTATGEHLGFCPQNESIFWREIWLRRASVDGRAALDAAR